MALLRREPREVYRVYGAEDFLAGADGEEHEPAPVCDGASRGQPRSARRSGVRGSAPRALSAAVLVAGVALACSLIVARNMPSSGRRGAQPAPTPARAGVSPGDAVLAGGPSRQAARGAPPSSPQQRSMRLTLHRRAAIRKPGSPAAASTAARSEPLAVAASAQPPQQQRAHLEFGFER
jgi:hypothetical protein